MRPSREDVGPTHNANSVESNELNSVISDALVDEPLELPCLSEASDSASILTSWVPGEMARPT